MEVPATLQSLKSDNIWIGDTGASNHCTFSNIGLHNYRYSKSSTMSATGTTQASEIGHLDVTACNKHGEEYAHCKLSGVIYNESFNFNLFSLSKMLGQGWSLNGDDKCITLISPCKSSTIMFDIVIKTPNGCIFATMLTRSHEITATNVQENKEPKLKPKIPTMTLMDAHRKLGHCDVEKAKRTAKAMGWRLTSSTMDPCAACAMGKAKQECTKEKYKNHSYQTRGKTIP